MLEQLQAPGAFWGEDRPIVLPVGELTEDDFVAKPAHKGAIHVWEDKRLADVPTTPTMMIHRHFDLTRGLD
jgi:hypothetical protein